MLFPDAELRSRSLRLRRADEAARTAPLIPSYPCRIGKKGGLIVRIRAHTWHTELILPVPKLTHMACRQSAGGVDAICRRNLFGRHFSPDPKRKTET
jgi:hypothetical protein